MKDLLVNSMIKNISKYYSYDEEKIQIIKYGLSSLYLTLSKSIVIFSLAYFLGIIKPLLILMTLYGLLRLTVFGVHAKKSWHCWISSLILFIGCPYLCLNLIIDYKVKVALGLICVILLSFFAPADTEKRPLKNQKKRTIYKIISIINSLIFTISFAFVENNTISNCILFSLMLSVFVVLPSTYKLFGVSYNNYKGRENKK